MSRYKIDPYLFDENEKIVLEALKNNSTPLQISRTVDIPRATIYTTLNKLKTRGLISEITVGKKKKWILKTIANSEAPNNSSGEIGYVKVHEGTKDVVYFLNLFIKEGKTKLKALSGDLNAEGWKNNFGKENIEELNKILSKKRSVTDAITSKSFIVENIGHLGEDWLKHFKNKPTEYHIVNEKYTNFKSQIFIRENKILLIDMSKPIIIEITDNDMTKCFESIFDFIKDNSEKITL